jgi:hypothetical protein
MPWTAGVPTEPAVGVLACVCVCVCVYVQEAIDPNLYISLGTPSSLPRNKTLGYNSRAGTLLFTREGVEDGAGVADRGGRLNVPRKEGSPPTPS